MYLYVLGFSKHPSLLKVGVSVSPVERIAKLEQFHGKCFSSVFYNMGKTYHRAEKLIHVLLEDSNVRVDGDGGTEFFKASNVVDVVEKVVLACDGKHEETPEESKTPFTLSSTYRYIKTNQPSFNDKTEMKQLQAKYQSLQVLKEHLQQQVEQLKQELAKAEEREEWLKQLLQANQQTIVVLLENQA